MTPNPTNRSFFLAVALIIVVLVALYLWSGGLR
jgi:hypothetical protein